MLLTGKRRARHDEHTLAPVVLALSLIDAAYGLQWEGVALRAPCAAIHLVLVVALTRVEEIWVGRVHPPGIGAVVVEAFQMFPVDGAGFGAESVVDLDARGILHHWGPDVGDAALRPRLDGQQQALLVELTELLCLRTETGPDGYHEVGVLLVYVLNQLSAVLEVLGKKVHGVPQIV